MIKMLTNKILKVINFNIKLVIKYQKKNCDKK